MASWPVHAESFRSVNNNEIGASLGQQRVRKSTQPRSSELVSGFERMERILRALTGQGVPISCLVGSLSFFASPSDALHFEENSGLILYVDNGVLLPLSGSIFVEAPGYNSVYSFASTYKREGAVLYIDIPKSILRIRRRNERRASVSATLSIKRPDEVVDDRFAINDISFSGISFWLPNSHRKLAASLSAASFEIRTLEGVLLEVSGSFKHMASEDASNETLCRIGIDVAQFDRLKWAELVHSAMAPSVRIDFPDGDACWELLSNSGYLGLSGMNVETFSTLKASYFGASKKLAQHPELGCQVTYHSQRGIEGAASMLKVYSGTYFGYQLAKRFSRADSGAEGRRILRELHARTYSHCYANQDMRWAMLYFQNHTNVAKDMQYEFLTGPADENRACISPFSAFRFNVKASALALDSLVDVTSANDYEQELLINHLAQTRPAAYIDALDLSSSKLSLNAVEAQWSKSGLLRRRNILVASRKGRPLMIAILESAEEGLHLYGLLDSVRLIPLIDIQVDRDQAAAALMIAVNNWYLSLGKTYVIYFSECPSESRLSIYGSMQLYGSGNLVLMSSDLVPDLLDYVYESTAPRARRRRGGSVPDDETRIKV